MRTQLTFSSGSSGWLEASREVTLAAPPLLPYPEDEEAWVAEVVAAGAAVRVTADIRDETRDGWPVRLIEAVVEGGEAAGEARLAAFFRFLELGGAVVFRGRDRDALERRRTVLLDAIASARPDWGPELVAVDDFFRDLAPGAEMSHRAGRFSTVHTPTGARRT